MFGFFFNIYPVVLLGHMVVPFLIFWETILFPIVTTPIYIPTNSVRGLHFLLILTNFLKFVFFLFWLMWGDFSLWFWFAFPWWLAILDILSCVWWASAFLPEFFSKFIFYPLACKNLNKSRVVATSCSVGLTSTMQSI